MAIFNNEMKQGFKALCIWTAAIVFMLAICVLMFPEMKAQMSDVSNMFSNMGSFTAAFGMDRLNFGELIGFYGVECGNILGIGGGFFAAYVGISIIAKEEKEHTAEFLLTHPVSRLSVVIQKQLAVASQIIIMNVVIVAFSLLSFMLIDEEMPMKEFLLMHVAYLALQLEIGLICTGISSFLKHGNLGIGLGFAALLYFMNIIRNISDAGEGLKYITPFAYAEPADIVADGCLDGGLIIIGVGFTVVAVAVGIFKYMKKDIAS